MSATAGTAPLWGMTAAEADVARPFAGDAQADLAIIGGGFTGLSAALHAAEGGLSAIVLEAETIGHGGSGRNVGLVNAGLWLPPDEVCRRLGNERGEALIRLLGAAPDEVFALVERHAMRCEAVRRGTIHAAHAPRGLKDLERRAAQWQRRGAPVALLDARSVASRIGSDRFHGGLYDPRAGTINPASYARGLARAAAAAGARIHGAARVEGIRREGADWRLRTARGSVLARRVLICTNAYSDGLWPGLGATFTPIRYFQLATKPLGERAAAILPGGEGIWDTGTIMFSLRKDDAGRLLVGSMGAVIGGLDGLSRRWAARKLARLFPALGPVGFETAWDGVIAMTPDHVPRLLRLAEGVFAPIGYNGRGIGPGTVFGRVLAEFLAGGAVADLPLALTAPRPIRTRRPAAAFYAAVFAANQLWQAL
ncbi:NAD(P)/FAD-dependent oxidoreductase [Albidovulum sp.]